MRKNKAEFLLSKITMVQLCGEDFSIRAYIHKLVKFPVHGLEGKLLKLHVVVLRNYNGNFAH